MTAPELLKQFQEAGEGIEAIHVDVSRMPYVSNRITGRQAQQNAIRLLCIEGSEI